VLTSRLFRAVMLKCRWVSGVFVNTMMPVNPLLSGENTVASQGPKARGIPAWGNAPGVEPTPIQGLKARPILCHSFCPREACHPRAQQESIPISISIAIWKGLRMWEAPPCGDFSTYDHQTEAEPTADFLTTNNTNAHERQRQKQTQIFT